LDLRREGVKNKRLFLNCLGVSPSFWTAVREVLNSDSSMVEAFPLIADGRVATTIDGGVKSLVNAVVEAFSNGDWLKEEPIEVDCGNGCNCPGVVSGWLPNAEAGKSVISIPSGEPKP